VPCELRVARRAKSSAGTGAIARHLELEIFAGADVGLGWVSGR